MTSPFSHCYDLFVSMRWRGKYLSDAPGHLVGNVSFIHWLLLLFLTLNIIRCGVTAPVITTTTPYVVTVRVRMQRIGRVAAVVLWQPSCRLVYVVKVLHQVKKFLSDALPTLLALSHSCGKSCLGPCCLWLGVQACGFLPSRNPFSGKYKLLELPAFLTVPCTSHSHLMPCKKAADMHLMTLNPRCMWGAKAGCDAHHSIAGGRHVRSFLARHFRLSQPRG
jgi:hypothetical protein